MNTERLSWLIENFQRLARLDERLDVPSQQQVELQTLAREVRASSKRWPSHASRSGSATGCRRSVDPARVELVLLNLVSNAIKYSDPAKPEGFV